MDSPSQKERQEKNVTTQVFRSQYSELSVCKLSVGLAFSSHDIQGAGASWLLNVVMLDIGNKHS
jgi:hypothetical protein